MGEKHSATEDAQASQCALYVSPICLFSAGPSWGSFSVTHHRVPQVQSSPGMGGTIPGAWYLISRLLVVPNHSTT